MTTELEAPRAQGQTELSHDTENESLLETNLESDFVVDPEEDARLAGADVDDEFGAAVDEGLASHDQNVSTEQDSDPRLRAVSTLVELGYTENAEDLIATLREEGEVGLAQAAGVELAKSYVAGGDIESLIRISENGILDTGALANSYLVSGDIESLKVLLQDERILGENHEVIQQVVARIEVRQEVTPEPDVPEPQPQPAPPLDPETLHKQLEDAYRAQIANMLRDDTLSIDERVAQVTAARDQAVSRGGLDRGELDELIFETLREEYGAVEIDSFGLAEVKMDEIDSIGRRLGFNTRERRELQNVILENVREDIDIFMRGDKEALRELFYSQEFDCMDDIQQALEREIKERCNTGNASLNRMVREELAQEAVRLILEGDPLLQRESHYEMSERAEQAYDLAYNLGVRKEVAETVTEVAARLYGEVPAEVKAQSKQAELEWLKKADQDLSDLREEFNFERKDLFRSIPAEVILAIESLEGLDNTLDSSIETLEQEARTQTVNEIKEEIASVVSDPNKTLEQKALELVELREQLETVGGMSRTQTNDQILPLLQEQLGRMEIFSLKQAEDWMHQVTSLCEVLALAGSEADVLVHPALEEIKEELGKVSVNTVEEGLEHFETIERIASSAGLSHEQREELKDIIRAKSDQALEDALAPFKSELDEIMNSGQSYNRQRKDAERLIRDAISDVRNPELREYYRQQLGLYALDKMLGDPRSVRTVREMDDLMDAAEELWSELPIKDQAAEMIASYAEEFVSSRELSSISNRELMFLKNSIHEIQRENNLEEKDKRSSSDTRDAAIDRLMTLQQQIDAELEQRRQRQSQRPRVR